MTAVRWTYKEILLPVGSSPDYATLGRQGWQLVAVYSAPFPESPKGDPNTGRAFVFMKQGD